MIKKNYEELKKQFIDFFKEKYYLPIIKKKSESNKIDATINYDFLPLTEVVGIFYHDPTSQEIWVFFMSAIRDLKKEEVIYIEIKREKERRLLSDFSMQEQAFFYANNVPMYCLFETEKTKKYYTNVLYFNEKTKKLKIALKNVTNEKFVLYSRTLGQPA